MSIFSKDEKITDIWKKYENGKDHHNNTGMYKNAERCHRFYEGDQWNGLQAGGEELPILNFIKPICTYKISLVATNNTAIIFSGLTNDENVSNVCTALNAFAVRLWEKTRMDNLKWKIIKNACITGDSYIYSFDAREKTDSVAKELEPNIKMRVIDKTNIYFADEQNDDINSQEWLIVAERMPVAKIKEIGKTNGISESDLALIASDEADNTNIGVNRADEVKSEDGKCTSLLFMKKTKEGIEFCRSVKSVIYQKPQVIKKLELYPIVGYKWSEKKGSARGIGVVEGIITNQIEVNRTIARRTLKVKQNGVSTMVYDEDKIANPSDIGKVGAKIAVRNLSSNPVSSMVQYLSPPPMGADAGNLQNEIITVTRELEGASDAATGQIDPTQASGEAIKAARDQSAMNLTEQSAAYKQFCEDLANVWYKLLVAYSENGVAFRVGSEIIKFTAEELHTADIDTKIDVSPNDPYSVLSREMSIENALAKKHISFEEYIEMLDESSSVPKDKFVAMLAKRQEMQALQPAQNAMPIQDAMPAQEEMMQAMPNMQSGAAVGGETIPPELLQQLLGGDSNAMP